MMMTEIERIERMKKEIRMWEDSYNELLRSKQILLDTVEDQRAQIRVLEGALKKAQRLEERSKTGMDAIKQNGDKK